VVSIVLISVVNYKANSVFLLKRIVSYAVGIHQTMQVLEGRLITKTMRQELFGAVAGGAGSRKPEDYQRSMIVQFSGVACPKTNMRINLRTNTLREIAMPNKHTDGFDYSEDFDGCQTFGEKKVYLNLKCIVGTGGSQTRSLREVYWFVQGQLNVLGTIQNTYFANILDGDEADSVLPKFRYLLDLPEYRESKNNVYVGDLKGYLNWTTQLK
jgi:hypothetical protein